MLYVGQEKITPTTEILLCFIKSACPTARCNGMSKQDKVYCKFTFSVAIRYTRRKAWFSTEQIYQIIIIIFLKKKFHAVDTTISLLLISNI